MHKQPAAPKDTVLGLLPTFNKADRRPASGTRGPSGAIKSASPASADTPAPKKGGMFSWLGRGSRAAKVDPKPANAGPDVKAPGSTVGGAVGSQGAVGSPSSLDKPDFKPDVKAQAVSFLEEVKQKTRQAEIEAEVLTKETEKRPELHARYHVQVTYAPPPPPPSSTPTTTTTHHHHHLDAPARRCIFLKGDTQQGCNCMTTWRVGHTCHSFNIAG